MINCFCDWQTQIASVALSIVMSFFLASFKSDNEHKFFATNILKHSHFVFKNGNNFNIGVSLSIWLITHPFNSCVEAQGSLQSVSCHPDACKTLPGTWGCPEGTCTQTGQQAPHRRSGALCCSSKWFHVNSCIFYCQYIHRLSRHSPSGQCPLLQHPPLRQNFPPL